MKTSSARRRRRVPQRLSPAILVSLAPFGALAAQRNSIFDARAQLWVVGDGSPDTDAPPALRGISMPG